MRRRLALLLPVLALLGLTLGCLIRGPGFDDRRPRGREQERGRERERDHDRGRDQGHDGDHH